MDMVGDFSTSAKIEGGRWQQMEVYGVKFQCPKVPKQISRPLGAFYGAP
jgi:hypothetical protein